MTVTVQTLEVSYVGNGVIVDFAYPFRVLDAASVKVYLNDVLQVGNYTLTGVGDQTGGTVTFNTAPGNAVIVKLKRETAITQQTDYQAYDAFPAETHEKALDRLTMIAQELDARIP